ncbi:MAG: hypothetical protein NTU98_09065 [Bacteroidetes bacterium]|nr:hypothetical protein [Bacteroidota bacterium]
MEEQNVTPANHQQEKLPATKKKSASELARLDAWQKKLLPFMVIVPTLLAAVFIYLATVQMMRFNTILNTKPDTTFIGRVLPLPGDPAIDPVLKNNLEYIKWLTLTHLEQESLYKRYNQGGLLLMSRIFTKYLGFFVGMILAIVGAVFIIGKLSEDYSSVGGEFAKIKFNVLSSSPGIIFCTLGTVLMVTTILQHSDITIQDSPLYLNAPSIYSISGEKPAVNNVNHIKTNGEKIDPREIESLFPDKKK